MSGAYRMRFNFPIPNRNIHCVPLFSISTQGSVVSHTAFTTVYIGATGRFQSLGTRILELSKTYLHQQRSLNQAARMSAALLSRVFEIPGILTTCTEFQDGTRLAEYPNGDIAAAEGHLSLLKIRRQLCRIVGTCGDKDPGVRVQEGANVSGNVPGERQELVRYAEDFRYTECAADWAATQGHLDVVKWLLKNRQEGCTESAIDGACWNGHSETVEWLVIDWGQEISERALDYAASTGRLELVKWLTERGAKCTSVAMDGAAGDGHLEVVRWLGQNRREGCSRAAFEMAAAGGHLHVIKWLDEAGLLRCSSRGLDNAAEGGHLDVLKWMQEHKSEHQCTSNAYGLAAGTGRLEVLEWLRDTMPNLCCPTWASEIAANSGHLTVVKWLHETGLCQASFATLDDAAALGRLEAVVWLSEHGGRATEAAVDRAAEAGYADVVSYLLKNRQEGCSPNAIVEAARNGHLAVVKVLLQHDQEQFRNHFLEAKSVAGDQGHDEVVRWLEEQDFNQVKDLEEALKSCTLGKCSTDASLALPNEAYNDNGIGSSGPERKSEAAGPRGTYEYVTDDDPGRGLSEKRSGCASPIAGDFLADEACHCSHDKVGTIDGDEVVPTRVRDGEVVGSDGEGASLPGREGTSLTSFVRRVIAVVGGFVHTLSSTDDRGRTPALSSGEREDGGGSI